MNVSAPSVIRNYKPFFYPCSSGLRRLFSLTSLRSFCLRLPRATLPKTVHGLWSRNATRFLLAAHQSPQAVSGCAGSVGCEQRKPDNRRSSLGHRVHSNGRGARRKAKPNFSRSHLLSLAGALSSRIFDRNDSPSFCGSQNRRPCRPGASRHGGRATGRTSNLECGPSFRTKWNPDPEACTAVFAFPLSPRLVGSL